MRPERGDVVSKRCSRWRRREQVLLAGHMAQRQKRVKWQRQTTGLLGDIEV